MATRDVIIGFLAGIVALIAMKLITPRPQPVPLVREVMTYSRAGSEASDANPATQPNGGRQNLNTILESVEMKRVPLSQALAKLSQMTGGNFIVEWGALGAAQIGDDQPITINLHQVRGDVALKALVDQLGGEREKIGYRVQDGIVRISTVHNLSREQFVRVYDIRDVIYDLYSSSKSFPTPNVELTKHDAVDEVTGTILRGVDPASWREAGGMASIEVFSGRLIVRQTLENHQAIARIIADLRRKQK